MVDRVTGIAWVDCHVPNVATHGGQLHISFGKHQHLCLHRLPNCCASTTATVGLCHAEDLIKIAMIQLMAARLAGSQTGDCNIYPAVA